MILYILSMLFFEGRSKILRQLSQRLSLASQIQVQLLRKENAYCVNGGYDGQY